MQKKRAVGIFFFTPTVANHQFHRLLRPSTKIE